MSDIIVGLQYGDEGKGKVTKYIIENGDYTHCVRFNGGPNAGHTVYINEKKLITHQIPTGIFSNLICVIGPNCVIDFEKLEKEIILLEINKIKDVRKRIKLSYNAHVIQPKHIEEDEKNDTIGSTKSGIRPVYRDKYDRCGLQIKDISNTLGLEVVNPYDVLCNDKNKILFEGAQGFLLDINWGHYPYVTSSQCDSGMITSCGYPFSKIKKVYGIAKLYTTYVGNRRFQPPDEIFKELQEIGEEFGATTNRMRQCDWLNLDDLIRAININGVTDLIINKCDVIKQLNCFKLYHLKPEPYTSPRTAHITRSTTYHWNEGSSTKPHVVDFPSLGSMRGYILNHLPENISVKFSFSKSSI